jgi:excisionase family DNA binding protein
MDPKATNTPTVEEAAPPGPGGAKPEGERPKLPSIPYTWAPPPPLPPGYKPISIPDDWYDQPKAWACRRCCRNFDWTYRPPREEELDLPCIRCRDVLDANERAVEVNRLLLAALNSGKRLTVAMQTSPAGPQPLEAAEINPSPGIACTVKEAGIMLGCGATKVYALLSQGRLLPAEKFGRKRMILRSSVEALLKAGGINSTPEPPRKATPAKPRAKDAKSLAAAIAKLSVK